MGVVKRQGIKKAMVNFLGVCIGMLSILFVYSLDNDIYGYAQFIFGSAAFLVPFASAGAIPATVKFFTKYKQSKQGASSLFGLLLMIAASGFIVFLLAILFWNNSFFRALAWLDMDVDLIKSNFMVILILTLTLILIRLLTAFASNYHRVVVPAIVTEFAYKLFLPSIVLCYYFNHIDKTLFSYLIVLFYVIVVVVLLIYLNKLGALRISKPSFIDTENRKAVGNYLFFGGLNSIGNTLAFRIDTIMLAIMLTPASAGLYSKIMVMSNVIDVPRQALNSIVAPLVSESWEMEDRKRIQQLYYRSSLNLLIPGLALFIIIYFALDGLIFISADPNSFEGARAIFVFLGLAKIVELISSINNSIISYSAKYKFNLIFIIILGLSNVFFNYYLIGEFNVMGAAMATALSLLLFNLIKLAFIFFNYKMHPFGKGAFLMMIIGGFVFTCVNFLPGFENPLLDSILRCGVASILLSILVYKLKISEDINRLIRHYWIKIIS